MDCDRGELRVDLAEHRGMTAAAAEEDERREALCRICLCGEDEGEGSDEDELLAPCKCSGSVKFVHRGCLNHWRRSGFDPATLTTCGLCRTDFRLQAPQPDAIGPKQALWRIVARYLGLRIGVFFGVVVLLGFLARWLLGDVVEDLVFWDDPLLNHLSLGMWATLALAGGVAVIQVMSAFRLAVSPFRWWLGGGGGGGGLFGGGGRKSKNNDVLVLLVVVGALYLLYHLLQGLFHVLRTGRVVAVGQLRQVNQGLRAQVVRDWRVLNLDPDDEARAEQRRRARQQRPPHHVHQEAPVADGGSSSGQPASLLDAID